VFGRPEDGRGDLALVKCIRPFFRDQAESMAQIRVLEQLSGVRRFPAGEKNPR
jgi:hypothetical protein